VSDESPKILYFQVHGQHLWNDGQMIQATSMVQSKSFQAVLG